MSNITQADIDRAMGIINTPFGGDRGMAILSKSNYMYLCGMVQAMTNRIAELEAMHDHQHLLDLADEMAKLQAENAKLVRELVEKEEK